MLILLESKENSCREFFEYNEGSLILDFRVVLLSGWFCL